MKKLSKLLALSLALNFLVPTYASASSEGQDEMKKISERPELYQKESYPLNYTAEFFESTYSSLYSDALDGNEDSIIEYAQTMRTGYEMVSNHKDKENQIWYVNKISAVCQTLSEKLGFKYVMYFLHEFALNPRYSNPITSDENNHYQIFFVSSCGKLTIEFSDSKDFYKVEFESLCTTMRE